MGYAGLRKAIVTSVLDSFIIAGVIAMPKGSHFYKPIPLETKKPPDCGRFLYQKIKKWITWIPKI